MQTIRQREEPYFTRANKSLEFFVPYFEVNKPYFQGYSNFPLSYTITYRNVMGGLSHSQCTCVDWKKDTPKETMYHLTQTAYIHRKHAMYELCPCGQYLVKTLEKVDKDGYSSHYCRTVYATPKRYIYRYQGVLNSILCSCWKEHSLETIDTSSESESESDTDEEYEYKDV